MALTHRNDSTYNNFYISRFPMQPARFLRLHLPKALCVVLCTLVALLSATQACLAENGVKFDSKKQKPNPIYKNGSDSVQIGVGGHLRLGCWTELRVPLGQNAAPAKLSITAVDPNGSKVDFRWQNPQVHEIGSKKYAVGFFKVGRQGYPIEIRIEDAAGKTTFETTISTSENSNIQVHPSTFSLWVQTGGKRSLSSIINTNQSDPDNQQVVIKLKHDQNHRFPVTTTGWSSIERLVIFPPKDNQTPATAWTKEQIKTIQNWVEFGGRISVSGTEYLKQISGEGKPFAFLLGSHTQPKPELNQTRNVSNLEIFAGSKSQVLTGGQRVLPFLGFPNFADQTDFQLEKQPVLARISSGFGQVDLIGLDFETAPLSNWKSSNSVIRKWLNQKVEGRESINVSFGYGDISGQLRMALEKFPSVGLISFTLVMGIIIFFLACCAGDYFLLRKVIKNVQLTWVTLPIYIILFTALSIWVFQSQKSSKVQVNQAEVIDILAESGRVRGQLWTHLYSPNTASYQLSLHETAPMDIKVDQNLLAWDGLPGGGLGAMRSKNAGFGASAGYTVNGDAQEGNEKTTIEGLKIALASTSSVTSSWTGKIDPSKTSSSLQYSARQDRLTGRIKNPMPVRLEKCYLVFGHWAYRLDRPINAGEDIDIQSDTTPISITRWLTQKKELEDTSVLTPWDPTNTDMQRILELMMFNELGGGRDYIRLTNRYRHNIDLSHLTGLGRAVFLGRTDQPASTWIVNQKAITSETLQRKATAIRMILPVKQVDKKLGAK